MRVVVWLTIWAAMLRADTGVLIPAGAEGPNPAILQLAEMKLDIVVDHGTAVVNVRQIFANRTANVQEGSYQFALPARATLSDFAVWDGVVRIPGVILERREAEETYQRLRAQAIDPGLLSAGERTPDDEGRTSLFSAKIFPIPGFGTKRLELQYQERIPVERLESYLAVPLRPDTFQVQAVGKLQITFELRSSLPVRDFAVAGKAYPMVVAESTPGRIRASFAGTNVTLREDLAFRWRLDPAKQDQMAIVAYRRPEPVAAQPGDIAPPSAAPEPGFFEAQWLVGDGPAANRRPQTVLVLFDLSLSMQWEKLERHFAALEGVLRSLQPADRFNLLLFHDEVTPFAPAPVSGDAGNVDRALASVRAARLRGGTNLLGALTAGLQQSGPDTTLLILSDGNATAGASVTNRRISEAYTRQWTALPADRRPKTYVFAVGDDANLPLLRLLTRQNGTLEWVRSTEPIDFKLRAFLNKIGRSPLDGLSLTPSPGAAVEFVYALEESVFPGSLAAWVGRYQRPGSVVFSAQGNRAGAPISAKLAYQLPERAGEQAHLPRTWAKARVDALLEQIDRSGEDRALIDEIIALSRKYKFVTPYTSFLAAPRSLLRPRVIRPGDPVLRIRTDRVITSVIALFPFGLVKPLRYLPQEDIWQTRFLAPADLPDGTHQVRVVLRDRQGRTYQETKSFVVVSKPPQPRVKLERTQYRAGQVVPLRVTSSRWTRTITARLPGALPATLRWTGEANASTGGIVLPPTLPPGRYTLQVTAEDVAHNVGMEEVALDVVP